MTSKVDATRESMCLLCCCAVGLTTQDPKGGQETALPSSQSSPTLANCLEEHVFLTKRKAMDVGTKDGQLDQLDNCTLRLMKSLQWPWSFREELPSLTPYPYNTLTQHAKLQHLGIKIQLNLTSANARLQKGLGTKVLAVPDRWLPRTPKMPSSSLLVQLLIFWCSEFLVVKDIKQQNPKVELLPPDFRDGHNIL